MPDHPGPDSGQPQPGRALIVVSERDGQAGLGYVLPDAGFLAQLIACRTDVSAYRRHRREQPKKASDLYRAGSKIVVKNKTAVTSTLAVA